MEEITSSDVVDDASVARARELLGDKAVALQGYEILERFHEEGESAKSTARSQRQNLLTYCRLNKGRVHFVVVFNLTRFAQDKYDHFALGSHLQSLGISLRSATEPIDDTSTGKLMEGPPALTSHGRLNATNSPGCFLPEIATTMYCLPSNI
jgi:DNA invertase Pin-like site-specific DNA recombinase